MSAVGADRLRPRERHLLTRARAGEAIPAADGVLIIERLRRVRDAIVRDETWQRASAFMAMVDGFVALLEDRDRLASDDLPAEIVRLENELDVLEARYRRAAQALGDSRIAESRLQAELLRVKAERDEFRDAARDADGQRLALQRQLERTG